MADKKSLSDLGDLTSAKPETPAVPEAVADSADAGEVAAEPTPAGSDQGASTQGPQIQAVLREQQLDKQGRAYATGRRKDAVARVWLKPGTGKIEVNGRDQSIYFARPTLRLVINQPFGVTDRVGQYDVVALSLIHI